MKPKIGMDKTASSAALLTMLGLLVANPVQANPELPTTDIASSEELSQSIVEDLELTPSSELLETGFSTSAMDLVADPMAQVTSVSQLRDVSPGDWAFEALRNLVERYGCIAGYPDGTFRGNRALTRYEFAAGVNACLQQIERLAGGVDTDSLESIRRLLQEFEAELTALGARVDNLEGRVSFLEDHQFSTTTKLFGQVVVGFQGRTGNEFDYYLDRFEDTDDQINVITNTQLSLVTQFSPNSMLLTGLQAGTGSTVSNTSPVLGSYVGLGYEGNTNGDVELSDLTYRHLFGNKFAFLVGTEGVSPVNVFRGSNRVESAGFGPLSRFALRNPIISIGGSGGGVGFDWQIANRFSMQAVYNSSLPNDPDRGGIFGAEDNYTTTGVQLIATPHDNLDISFQYLNSYSPFGFLGTGVGDDQLSIVGGDFRAPMSTNAFGAGLDWRIQPWITLGGWFGYTNSDVKNISGSVETINWMAYLNFPDLFAEGNLGGIYIGQPPRITSSDLTAGRNIPSFVNEADPFANSGGQPSTTMHLEAFYRFRATDNIHITPGVIYIINPGQNSDNDDIVIGAIRTTFSF
jgi:hypothetical protein